jgi:hypothetical protein
VVQIRDNAGHDLSVGGVEVTVSVSSGRGQLQGTRTVATDASGRATFGDLRITGATGSHKLIFAADGYRSVTSNKIEVEKASTTVAVTDDPDPTNPGDPVTVSVTVSSPAGTPTGEVEISANGSPSCTVAAPQGTCQVAPTSSGNITATYKGSDVFESSSASTSHQVNEPPPPPVNQPPVAREDTYSTPFATVLEVPAPGVLANDEDPEGGSLTAQLADAPSQGIVTLGSDGSFTYFPGGVTGAIDTFTYDVSDGTSTVRQTVTITVQ